MKTTIVKKFGSYAMGHRQPHHTGHCKLIHGHNVFITVTLESEMLDKNGFVYDFGNFEWLKDFLKATFDHKLIISQTDPHLGDITSLCALMNIHENIVIVKSGSAECLAKLVLDYVQEYLENTVSCSHIDVLCVEFEEDEKNRATVHA